MKNFQTIAEEVNNAADAHQRMRNFQGIRQQIHGLSRVKTKRMFSQQTTKDYWAAHSGGRKELQYNIGFERKCDTGFEDDWFRYGVAFSLTPSQSLPDPLVLRPKIEKYNEYIKKNGAELGDLSFWYWIKQTRSVNLLVAPIPENLIHPPNFLFLGRLCKLNEFDAETVVFLFDRLLDLYQYVEGNTSLVKRPANLQKGFQFKAGCAQKAASTSANVTGGTKAVILAHNNLEQALFDILSARYGATNVGAEKDTGRGSRVDLVVHANGKHRYYEIKTDLCVRSCVRQAVGQLLEYSYWPGGHEAEQLVVVSENRLTDDAGSYIKALRQRFGVPVFYQHLDLKTKTLGPLQ